MNFQEPYRIHQIDLNKLDYNKIKKSNDKRIIYIKYKDNNKITPLVIQLPTLLNINKAVKITDEYYELEIPLITKENNKSDMIVDFFEKLDKKIINDTKLNTSLWFENNQINSIKYKKTIKESDTFKDGVIKLKIIKTIDFETILQMGNKNKININDIPENYWFKSLIEIYALVMNYNSKTLSLFIRPVILSFQTKQIDNYQYKLLDDSNSEEENDIPDSEITSKPYNVNDLFIKQTNQQNNDDNTSSQIKFIEPPPILMENIEESNKQEDNNQEIKQSPETSSEKEKTDETDSNTEDDNSSSEETSSDTENYNNTDTNSEDETESSDSSSISESDRYDKNLTSSSEEDETKKFSLSATSEFTGDEIKSNELLQRLKK